MDNKYEILRILRESDASVSGQELSERIGISRTAVWKHIRSLEEEGYGIEAVNRKGYRLVGVPDSIAAREVGSRLTTHRMGRDIRYFSLIDSINQYAKRANETGSIYLEDIKDIKRGQEELWILMKEILQRLSTI